MNWQRSEGNSHRLLLSGISSQVRGGVPPCRFMSMAKALKSARALRSAKNNLGRGA
jgi:hypothetical protein